MFDKTIRRIKDSEFEEIYKHIESDFAKGEYAPYDVLYKQLQIGVQGGFILCEGKKDVAYAICAGGHINGFVLLSLLSVYSEFRGHGIGSAFLDKLNWFYKEKQGIIVEVERPEDALSRYEKEIRLKRIAFYEKAGYHLIPSIDYSIWGIPMHLMALPLNTSNEDICEKIGQIIYDVYLELMGKHFIHQLKFVKNVVN